MKQTINNIYQVAVLQLVYKQTANPNSRPKITKSLDCYRVFSTNWNQEIKGFIESFKILLLNRANRVIGLYDVSTGSTCSAAVDAKVIFTTALKYSSCHIVLAHNHPSGNIKPSQADILLTGKLKEAGRFLDIEVLDHIILSGTDDKYFSFSDEGLM